MEKKLHSVLEQYDSDYKTYCGNIHIQYTIQFMTLHKHLALARFSPLLAKWPWKVWGSGSRGRWPGPPGRRGWWRRGWWAAPAILIHTTQHCIFTQYSTVVLYYLIEPRTRWYVYTSICFYKWAMPSTLCLFRPHIYIMHKWWFYCVVFLQYLLLATILTSTKVPHGIAKVRKTSKKGS